MAKNDQNSQVDFIAPFDGSDRNLKKTCIYTSLISNDKWIMNFSKPRSTRTPSRIWKIRNFFIIRDQWWVYMDVLHISTTSIEWRNKIGEIPKFMFFQFFSVSLIPMKIVKKIAIIGRWFLLRQLISGRNIKKIYI